MTGVRAPAAVVVVVATLGLAACGGVQSAETQAPEPSATPSIQQAPPPTAPKPKPRPPKMKACDANIRARAATTTCPFAQNVFYGYWLNEHEPGVFADAPGIPAYSPAAGRMFYLDCAGSSTISCKNSDGALVIFAAASVARYTISTARTYAAKAQLGDVPPPDPPAAPLPPETVPPPDEADQGGACDPNYTGACLDRPGDYDCEGGSGNGPNYTGPVTVVGADPYGLDRDGNGVGCE